MGQYLVDASLAHRVHRDTIRQAITFVRACFVKCEAGHECFMALWRHFDIRTSENFLSLSDSSSASLFAVLRKEIQEFHEHILGSNQVGFRSPMACRNGALMPLVFRIEERYKVECVNKDDVHGCCFGAP